MASGYFEFIRDFLKNHSGLVVTPEKMYLLETRLMPLVREHGYASIDALVDVIRNNPHHPLATEISEAMNTHESLFFRDREPFDTFRDTIVPEVLKRRSGQRKLRIWCAACSSGQEPYSLAMILDEMTDELKGWRVEIIATDISRSVLDRAQEGMFSQFEVQRGLPVKMLMKYFKQHGEFWQLSSEIRAKVTFRQQNLLQNLGALGTFDMVMCRNVLIYFDLETKAQVLESIGEVLSPDGVVFLGSSESTMGITEKLWPVKSGRGVYKHKDGPTCLVEPS
ncbi:protein-glutamate O-methyltransferase CheR [Magnetovibrio sp. PR-2]|uniref:CheR family methyltransferase n=1 Tax=Magnetovibrio sp. PR-2 TaxID=3120356 RepID=UPI002FCE3EEF